MKDSDPWTPPKIYTDYVDKVAAQIKQSNAEEALVNSLDGWIGWEL